MKKIYMYLFILCLAATTFDPTASYAQNKAAIANKEKTHIRKISFSKQPSAAYGSAISNKKTENHLNLKAQQTDEKPLTSPKNIISLKNGLLSIVLGTIITTLLYIFVLPTPFR